MEDFNTDEPNVAIDIVDLEKTEAILFKDEREITCADACKIWRQVRLILQAFIKSGILDPKHKKALQIFGRTMDKICLK